MKASFTRSKPELSRVEELRQDISEMAFCVAFLDVFVQSPDHVYSKHLAAYRAGLGLTLHLLIEAMEAEACVGV